MKLIKQIAIITILISVTVYALIFFNKKFEFFCTNSQGSEYYQIYGVFGDYIGGILGTLIGFITLILVYITYTSQKTELKLQRQLITQQQFESTFFNMLNVHRELKNHLELSTNDYLLNDIKNKDVIGIEVFSKISEEYKCFYKLFNSEGKFIQFKYLKNNSLVYNKLIKNKIETGSENSDSVISHIKHFEIDESNKAELFNDEKWDENLSELKFHKIKIDYTFKLLFENYQHIISHYCRNVYHILKFIKDNEDQNKLNYRKYADIFQSQLNVNEQFILYYNFYHFNDEEKENLSTIKLVEHYQFLENLGLNNLITEIHKKLYPNLNLK